MKQFFKNLLALAMLAGGAFFLTGCGGDAETTITELESIAAEEDDHDDESSVSGRLFVLNAADIEAEVFDLVENELITSVPLDALPSSVYASGDYRFAALVERSEDKVGFVDGGLYQELHDDHYDLFTTTPSLSNYTITGSRPTHFVPHDGLVALFLDGDSTTGANGGILVFDDETIEQGDLPLSVEFTNAHHGVAEPRGDDLITSVRRDDSLSTSANFILPDQIALYRLSNDSYELTETFDVTCPDLHGAAQNETHVVFACSDGVVLIEDNGDGTYTPSKLDNPDELFDDTRIGTLWGHHESEQFIGQANGGDAAQFFAIDPEEGEIELIDWQPETDAAPVARDFTFEAEQFVILDSQGYLTVIEPHDDGGHTHWEFGERLDITDADVSTLPADSSFDMTVSQSGHDLYVSDPIEQHILVIDLELLAVEGDIELDYIPSELVWLGIAESHEE